MSKVVVLSPHLDDAVLNCWHTISNNDCMVLTVFAGVPRKGTTKLWDLLCGEHDGNRMMCTRRQENENALAGTGCTIQNFDYLDQQYRGTDTAVDIDQLVTSILLAAPKDATFLAPLAASRLFHHEDHLMLRTVGIRLMHEKRHVQFYPDSPYMSLPTKPNTTYTVKLNALAKGIVKRDVAVVERILSVAEQIKKMRALEAYESQYKMTNLISLGGVKRIVRRPYELIITEAGLS